MEGHGAPGRTGEAMAQDQMIGAKATKQRPRARLPETPRYRARFAEGPADFARAETLRALAFRGDSRAADADAFDPLCRHLLIETRDTGALVGTCRLLYFADGRRIGASYSAQFYDLAPLAGYPAPMLELGRFCIAPGAQDADVLRLAWAALARIVTDERVGMLFGCSSFKGTDADLYADAFAMLNGWIAARGLKADALSGPDGRHMACQIEFYRISPRETPDPAQHETDILIKLA